MTLPDVIYHITTVSDWRRAMQAGRYTALSLETEGFIHASTAEQVLATAERFYTGLSGLVLLEIAVDRLDAELRYELAPGINQTFPHVYGSLNLNAVNRVLTFEPDPVSGKFFWPQAD